MACWQQAKMLYKYKGSRHTHTHTHTPPDELNQSSATAELRVHELDDALHRPLGEQVEAHQAMARDAARR